MLSMLALVRTRLGVLLLLVAAALSAMPTAPVRADEPSHSQVALAREQFVAGVTAARENDWQTALRAFERSQALYPHPATLFNIAGARRRLGRFVAAVEAYRRFLLAPASDTSPAQRAEAESAISDIEPRLAHLTVHVEHAMETDVLALDGSVLPGAVIEQSIPVDPGAHELTLTRDGTVVARASVTLAVAEPGAVTLKAPVYKGKAALTPAASAASEPALAPGAPRRDASHTRRRWMWVAIGVGVAAVGATVAAVVLTRDREQDDYVGNFPPGEVEIR
jgi:hypothetical protein